MRCPTAPRRSAQCCSCFPACSPIQERVAKCNIILAWRRDKGREGSSKRRLRREDPETECGVRLQWEGAVIKASAVDKCAIGAENPIIQYERKVELQMVRGVNAIVR